MNYGAMLQAWALQKAISSLGYECELINFRRRQDLRLQEILWNLKEGHISKGSRALMFEFLNWRKHMRFKVFATENSNLSPHPCHDLTSLAALSSTYGAIVSGSDQVWNPDLAEESLGCYLFDFPATAQTRRIAYAASIGSDSIDEAWHPMFRRCLERFDAISVRETSAVPLISALAAKEVTAVLDPTILIPLHQWHAISSDMVIREPFLLVYSFGTPASFRNIVHEVSNATGLSVVTLHKRKHYNNELGRFPYAGPQEFVGLFRKAAFVVTNSFHGTVFSVLFQKPFVSVINNKRGSRLRDLLKALDLEERLIHVDSELPGNPIEDLDYRNIEARLTHLREQSIQFLSDALKGHQSQETRSQLPY